MTDLTYEKLEEVISFFNKTSQTRGFQMSDRDKYVELLEFVKMIAQPEARKFTQEYGDVAEILLKEIGEYRINETR